MEKISITHMSNAHTDWLRALDFYKQELNVLKERLTEVARKNTGNDVMKNVEHFENQFKVQLQNIDMLRHDIHTNIASTSNEAQKSKAGYIDSTLLTQHNNLKQKYVTEEKTINDIRNNFNRFAAEWM